MYWGAPRDADLASREDAAPADDLLVIEGRTEVVAPACLVRPGVCARVSGCMCVLVRVVCVSEHGGHCCPFVQ